MYQFWIKNKLAQYYLQARNTVTALSIIEIWTQKSTWKYKNCCMVALSLNKKLFILPHKKQVAQTLISMIDLKRKLRKCVWVRINKHPAGKAWTVISDNISELWDRLLKRLGLNPFKHLFSLALYALVLKLKWKFFCVLTCQYY